MKNLWKKGRYVLVLIVLGAFALGLYFYRKEDLTFVDQLAVVSGQPVVLHQGIVYRGSESAGWSALDSGAAIKQVLSGEKALCMLDEEGNLFYEGYSDTEDMPSDSNYNEYMAIQALIYNEDNKIQLVNHSLDWSDFRAMTDDNTIIYQDGDGYLEFHLEEKVLMLSGSFILTEKGNVYRMDLQMDESAGKVSPLLELVYDKGDILFIDASESAARCIGMTREHKAIIWSDLQAPDISNWKNLVKVVHGFNYVVGLNQDGDVLFAHYDEDYEVSQSLLDWENIIGVEAYFNTIYGVKSNGEWLEIEL